MKSNNRILAGAVGAVLSAIALVPMAAQAVVVVGGNDGWEISFDGNVNGFYVYSDRELLPTISRSRTVNRNTGNDVAVGSMDSVAVTQGGFLRPGALGGAAPKTSRVRTGLLPAFFSFNVRSPEVKGLTGSARISFAPQIQNANTKNNFRPEDTQAGAQIDMREVFFNVDGGFGTISVGRTLSLFQRHNILTDMTLFGVGVDGAADGGGTTLGRIGYGYVYPQFNARISYRTPEVDGFQLEFGAYDPSRICGGTFGGEAVCATETDIPRWEAEATWATRFVGGDGGVKLFLSGMSQQAEGTYTINSAPVRQEIEAHGVAGGLVLDYAGLELVGSGYIGEGLGTVLMLDTDSTDSLGDERENHGYIGQLSYTFFGATKLGASYGVSAADETGADTAERTAGCGTPRPGAPYGAGGQCETPYGVSVKESRAITFGLYHDFTSWFKLVAEYTRAETEWHDGAEQEADIYALGAFFLW